MSCLSFPRFPSSYVPYPSILVSYPPFLFHSFLFVFHTHLTSFLVVRIYPPTAHLGFIKLRLLEIDQKSFIFLFYCPVSFIELGSSIEAAPQPGFDSSFLEWSSFKPSHVGAVLLASRLHHKAQRCSAGASVSAQSKAQKLLAPFYFMGAIT